MIKVNIKNLNRTLHCEKGENLLKVIQKHHINIQSSCGGNGTCGKCKVFNCDENKFILSCQTTVTKEINLIIDTIETDKVNDLNLTNVKRTDIKKAEGYGLIADIGTTTLAIYLLDLSNGEIIDKSSCINPQSIYGADVLSRIEQAKKQGTATIQGVLVDSLNKTISEFKTTHSISKITVFYASGNTTMLHIFLNINPESIGVSPYTPVFLEQKEVAGKTINLDVDKVIILPSISSFVGADITMGIIASGMLKYKKSLLIDLGTNGEIVLKNGKTLFATSTAAGPAFEGANIACGSGGIPGAITRVDFIENKLDIAYLGDRPRTITGSGIVDFISILLDKNVINQSGAYNLVDHHDFTCKDGKVFITNDIYLSQKDVRQVQLAKSAIRSGIDTLLNLNGIDYSEIEKVFIAGGFGFYLNPVNAIAIKLLPEVFINKIDVIGNSSAAGAFICALNEKQLESANLISKQVKVIELSVNKIFNNYFIENLSF